MKDNSNKRSKRRRPEFIKLPPAGVPDPETSLSRSTLNRLTLPTRENNFSPPVKSYVVKSFEGSRKGRRLIDYDSLSDFIRKEEE